jgi:hypothetical protein
MKRVDIEHPTDQAEAWEDALRLSDHASDFVRHIKGMMERAGGAVGCATDGTYFRAIKTTF